MEQKFRVVVNDWERLKIVKKAGTESLTKNKSLKAWKGDGKKGTSRKKRKRVGFEFSQIFSVCVFLCLSFCYSTSKGLLKHSGGDTFFSSGKYLRMCM